MQWRIGAQQKSPVSVAPPAFGRHLPRCGDVVLMRAQRNYRWRPVRAREMASGGTGMPRRSSARQAIGNPLCNPGAAAPGGGGDCFRAPPPGAGAHPDRAALQRQISTNSIRGHDHGMWVMCSSCEARFLDIFRTYERHLDRQLRNAANPAGSKARLAPVERPRAVAVVAVWRAVAVSRRRRSGSPRPASHVSLGATGRYEMSPGRPRSGGLPSATGSTCRRTIQDNDLPDPGCGDGVFIRAPRAAHLNCTNAGFHRSEGRWTDEHDAHARHRADRAGH